MRSDIHIKEKYDFIVNVVVDSRYLSDFFLHIEAEFKISNTQYEVISVQ